MAIIRWLFSSKFHYLTYFPTLQSLCDENIISDTKTLWQSPYYGVTYSLDPWFYTITQDSDIYNSWYENGHYNDCTGTPYYNGG